MNRLFRKPKRETVAISSYDDIFKMISVPSNLFSIEKWYASNDRSNSALGQAVKEFLGETSEVMDRKENSKIRRQIISDRKSKEQSRSLWVFGMLSTLLVSCLQRQNKIKIININLIELEDQKSIYKRNISNNPPVYLD